MLSTTRSYSQQPYLTASLKVSHSVLLSRLLIVTSLLLLLGISSAIAFPNPDTLTPLQREPFAARMRAIADDFQKLAPLIASEKAFNAKANEEEIGSILKRLQTNFLAFLPASDNIDPAYDISLYSIRDILSDAELRYQLGKKEYARWRLRSLSSNCVSCHARFSFGDTYRGLEINTDHLSDFEKGEYFLATRQFDIAKKAYLKAAQDASLTSSRRMEALRKVLLSLVRISEDPREGLSLFTKLASQLNLPEAQQRELREWIRSFRRWVNEPVGKVSEFRRAENLIQQYRNASAPGAGQVELLRASAILHKMLATKVDEGAIQESRGRALFLLGEAYAHMPLFFASELPEFYFERCIQEFPGSRSAKDAYRSYYDLMIVNYSGSAGLDLPIEVSKKIRALHALAFSESNKEL